MEERQMNKKQFYIGVNGKQVEVTEEVYLAYYRSKRRDRYFERDIKTERAIRDNAGNIVGYAPSKEDSLERIISANENFIDDQESVEDAVIRAFMSDALHKVLDKLPEVEQQLIDALFFSNGGKGMTEREYAKEIGITQKAVNKRKHKVLAKLKNLFMEN